jgi:hypothetical protein
MLLRVVGVVACHVRVDRRDGAPHPPAAIKDDTTADGEQADDWDELTPLSARSRPGLVVAQTKKACRLGIPLSRPPPASTTLTKIISSNSRCVSITAAHAKPVPLRIAMGVWHRAKGDRGRVPRKRSSRLRVQGGGEAGSA